MTTFSIPLNTRSYVTICIKFGYMTNLEEDYEGEPTLLQCFNTNDGADTYLNSLTEKQKQKLFDACFASWESQVPLGYQISPLRFRQATFDVYRIS